MRFREARLLADENISPKVTAFLRENGCNILDVKEEGRQGESDELLLQSAYREQRFILTHDSDFGTLAVNQGQPCYGIVYLRLKNLNRSNVIKIFRQILRQNIEINPGSILVVKKSRIRIRQVEHISN